ncbi:translation elongation factor P-lysine lysyltransferase [Citrifermentans bemidjiense Bem]|uniref:Translation elongation factor P-lysine lysyltransferase n=1 Tax=Citrifermentans bemidjiense (strain ATCC BAA-1014 / DSM 16622 / JCM 12645 / Bem) TaxID=404380 RepID=B5ECN2_CITBB|nr:EF-P lysine aminoacylase EpmA [Citrifermentans bemidjiense]ACH39067.1 translation elongation factor P-lysine lysyltransferase [Citrifermentans bemidjiense Bem]
MGSWPLARRRQALVERGAIFSRIREFFQEKGYLEVETPFRIPAPAPEAQIDAIPASGWFLQTSPELCMKRMLAAGYQRIFQICRCWRDGERGARHLSEFTMLEWYRSEADYLVLMEETEALVQHAAATGSISYRGQQIELSGKWERITVANAFLRYAGTSMWPALAEGTFDEIMVELIEPNLGLARPTFIYDYPASCSALARLKPSDPTVAERFELYIGGLEIANAFSELIDPVEQRARFVAEAAERAAQGKTGYPMPEKFLSALDEMPEAAGIALGLDRLVMVLLDAEIIDEVVAFTTEEL